MNNMLINNGLMTSGIVRAYVIKRNDTRVFIPGMMNNNIMSNGVLDESEYEKNKKLLPEALFSSIALRNMTDVNPTPCWVVFENGDINRPIVMGFFGKGVKNINNGNINNDVEIPPSSESPNYKDVVGNNIQQQIVNYSKTFHGSGTSAQSGYCQAWVADVYHRVLGGSRQSKSSAKEAGEEWSVSDDMTNIPLGACVYALYNPYGHVAIYIGNDEVASNAGTSYGIPRIETLSNFTNWASKKSGFTKMCWGWNGGSSYDLTKMN